LLLAGLVGCYSPTVHPGAPCGAGSACPGDLVCAADQTCQRPGTVVQDAAVDLAPPIDMAIDAPFVPPNDQPDGAIDITDGGDFVVDLTNAQDDAQKPASQGTVCGADGARDVYYTVHLAHREVFYFDTFGSDFDTVIRVFSGPCTAGAAPSGTSCHNNAPCGNHQTQWVGTLNAGDTCIEIDGDGPQTGSLLKLHAERGFHDGTRIAQFRPSGTYTLTGDTTGKPNFQDGSCAQHGKPEVAYYYIQCPGDDLAVTATTCNATTAATPWDTVLYAHGPSGELACQDDDMDACVPGGGFSTITFSSTDAHLYWIVVDGAGGTPSEGAYQLDVTFP
jgi:hypothetical protein